MATPKKFSRKLPEAVGSEAADEMVDWMNERESEYSDLRADFAELRQEMVAVREEMRVGFAKVDAKFATVEARFSMADARLVALEASLDAKFERFGATQIRWSLGLWIATIAALATILRLPR